jgi:hypothetical protein
LNRLVLLIHMISLAAAKDPTKESKLRQSTVAQLQSFLKKKGAAGWLPLSSTLAKPVSLTAGP